MSAISLVLQRKDRRLDRVKPVEFRAAVVELYDLAYFWAHQADDLRLAIRRWREAGCPDEDEFRILEELLEKQGTVADFMLVAEALKKFLRIYAPELEESLTAIAGRSLDNLREMVEQLLTKRAEGELSLDLYIRGVEDRTDEVLRAVEALGESPGVV